MYSSLWHLKWWKIGIWGAAKLVALQVGGDLWLEIELVLDRWWAVRHRCAVRLTLLFGPSPI